MGDQSMPTFKWGMVWRYLSSYIIQHNTIKVLEKWWWERHEIEHRFTYSYQPTQLVHQMSK